jgi:hypothetical protein
MAITRDFLNPILKHAPKGARPARTWGALVVALLAAINPVSYFTKPYIGAIVWMILSWWFYNENPYGLIRPKKPDQPTLVEGNPKWFQTTKSLLWALVFNFVPLFFIYLVMLLLARLDSKAITFV